jgi:hypothetical protein
MYSFRIMFWVALLSLLTQKVHASAMLFLLTAENCGVRGSSVLQKRAKIS